MAAPSDSGDKRRIAIAVVALGGQGGGVLCDWIVEAAEANGFRAQATSVPGVAQRTGSTVYYVELFPEAALAEGAEPLMGLIPAPGDIDIVIAAELMEAGRAMVRGFVSARTTLIASSHRVYAISEKSAMADGRVDGAEVMAAAAARSGRFLAFDMEAAADRAGSVISSVLLGALCGSGALPIPREGFEQAIRAGGVAVERNLAGFAEGVAGVAGAVADDAPSAPTRAPTTAAGRRLAGRVAAELPAAAQPLALEGVRRLMDYQDEAYADLYLDRLAASGALGGGLAPELARHLALWMSYEDTIRVADLKTRRSRFARVRSEVRAGSDQLVQVAEFMSPGLREVCETMPAPVGRAILASPALSALLKPFVGKGRRVVTTNLAWFLVMWLLAALRPIRRSTLRYQEEQARIEAWLALVFEVAATDPGAALELVKCQKLVRGYSDTHARGLRNFQTVVDAYRRVAQRPDAASIVRGLREAALADEHGSALAVALGALDGEAPPAAPTQRSKPRLQVERRSATAGEASVR